MTLHPSRPALLFSLMALGLSAGTQASAEDDPTHDDVSRVMRVLGIDAPMAPAPEACPQVVAKPPRRSVARPVQAEERRALLQLIRPETTAPLEVAVDTAADVVPEAPAVAEGFGRTEVTLVALAGESENPAEPAAPDVPTEAPVLVGLVSRPADEPDDHDPLHAAPWTLDWLPPPGSPAAPAEGDTVAVLVDDRAGTLDPDHLLLANVPIDAAQDVVQVAQAPVLDEPVHADRVLASLAGVRVGGEVSATPVIDLVVPADVADGDAPARATPRADYVQARIDGAGDAVGATPTDRVLSALAALRGVPEVEETPPEQPVVAAVPEPEPVVSVADASRPAAVSPIEHVLNDLAALRSVLEAEEAEPARAPWQGETVAMNSSQLDGVRGGFMTDTGLTLSFGIERAVYINGTLVTMTSLNVADLSKLSAGQAAVTTLNGGALAVVQSGAGNTVLPGAVIGSAVGTVIQNTLDNQKIQSVTTVNATVNSAGILRSLNLQQSVQSAITNSLRR
ncbi:hypothetical protein [Rhizobacter sp. Root1221]|uniref:hypothetical protein n=1 Tax=Rhizobacter sp. Root1221 TaxID=1736433 RepID=UPI0006F1C834|nr:hypothetical protein [Rhizobacter sp. Root1221]KQV90144.1 hypothetical protein ASC87_28375 [Rhizobacter sp. Root1221]